VLPRYSGSYSLRFATTSWLANYGQEFGFRLPELWPNASTLRGISWSLVCAENSGSAILVMKAAENRS
jgi:hypothetical protein